MSAVYLVIGCDVDPDRERLLDGVPPGTLTWRGATEGIPALKDQVSDLSDAAGKAPAFTWFLRADQQVRAVCGDYAWFPRSHRGLIRSLEATGDELGWHPHFWRQEQAGTPWFQEVVDADWQVAMLRGAHRELAAALPTPPHSVRMGWSYHTNRTFATLAELGIAAEFSAIPGFRTYTGRPPLRSENLFDWHATPRYPYFPATADYRRPPRDGESAHPVLEVPSFVSTSVAWSLVAGLQLARKTGKVGRLWDAVRRPTYCITVTARPPYFRPLVTELRRILSRPLRAPLVVETHFHADELLPNRSGLYDLPSVRANLAALLATCDAAGVRAEFVPAGRIPSLLRP